MFFFISHISTVREPLGLAPTGITPSDSSHGHEAILDWRARKRTQAARFPRTAPGLHQYYRVQQAWGLGSLKLKRRQAMLDIWAEYCDNRVRQTFLGQGKWTSACMETSPTKGQPRKIILIVSVHWTRFLPKKYYICKMNTTAYTKSVLVV